MIDYAMIILRVHQLRTHIKHYTIMQDAILTTLCETSINLIINIEKDLIRINRIHIRQCVRTNGIPANESRDLFTVTYELMCVILNFACLDNHMNYLKKSYRVKKCILLNIL